MERLSFEIERPDVAEALHAQAEAHGRSVEAEVAALVEEVFAPKGVKHDEGRARIERLIQIARGVGFDSPP